MIKFKDYGWALEGLAALILLVAFVLMIFNMNNVSTLVIQLTGLGILFFTIVRIKPMLANRDEKDYLLIIFSELLIDLVVGIIFLFFATKMTDKALFSFSHLSGLVLFVRGIVHFYTTSKRYELHDIYSFIVHILFMSFGFLFLWENNLTNNKIAVALLILCALLVLYFGYRTYKGYGNYRTQKVNTLKMQDYLNKKEDKKEKDIVIDDPKKKEEQINPKIIEEPKEEERPTVKAD